MALCSSQGIQHLGEPNFARASVSIKCMILTEKSEQKDEKVEVAEGFSVLVSLLLNVRNS